MKAFKHIWIIALLLAVALVGCKKDDPVGPPPPPAINETEVLLAHLETANYINTAACPSIVSAAEVRAMQLASPTRQYIIDLRTAADFTAGRIQGAVNVTLANLLTHVKGITATNYDRIAIVCYSGQTSAYGTSLLRLMGYSNVFSMKFGMSSWDSVFAQNYWTAKIGNARAASFVTTPTPKNPSGSLPTFPTTGKTTGHEILEARVNTLLAAGYSPIATISDATLYANLTGYYIVNYWPLAQYNDPGHIPGAVQYTPREDLKSTTFLKTLPTDKPIVVYCYTGQTSSFVVPFLRLLGYDAKSLLYGANSMIYDMMVARNMTVWKPSEIMRYPYITG